MLVDNKPSGIIVVFCSLKGVCVQIYWKWLPIGENMKAIHKGTDLIHP